MARKLHLILSVLRRLTELDFDDLNPDARGIEQLDQLCDELAELNAVDLSAPAMFDLMERLSTVDLGNPGSLVHTLERWDGKYQRYLAESLARKPSSLTVWMINRILNSRPVDSDLWFGRLRAVDTHPLASAETKAAAKRYLEHQRTAGRTK